MRIAFIGSVEFSARALETLFDIDAHVVGVCTLESAPGNADHADLSILARQHNVPWRYAPDINDVEGVRWLSDLRPDVIFCFGWSRLLKRQLLEMAPLGAIGYHPTLLPANRGRHPLIWALVLGLPETGSTFFFMRDGADDGDILSQARIPIQDSDDARALYDRMTATAMLQIREFVPALASGKYERRPQDSARSSTWRKRSKADGVIDWRMPARGICNLVRALARPYMGAHFVHQSGDVKVWRVEPVTNAPRHVEPGRVIDVTQRGPIVRCGDDAVLLLSIDPPLTLKAGEYL